MLLTPAYQLVVGKRKVDTTEEPRASTVEELVVRLDMEAPADSLTLRLGNVGGLEPEVGDQVSVKLGYVDDDDLTLVLTGRVVSVDPALPNTRMIAHSHAQRLLDAFLDETFENKSAGEIVQSLADEADVTVAQADPGAVLPAYVVDGRRNLHQHIRDLAELSGFDLFFNPDGELVFRRFKGGGGNLHVFEHAKHVVELDVRASVAAAPSVETFGESPGTSRGSESWAWLTKDFSHSKGSAGSGSPSHLIERPALRTRELAQNAADGAFHEITANATRGRLLTFGRPQVFPGDSLRIKDAPDDRVNGDFQVRTVRHRITKSEGFTTDIEFRGIG